MLVDTVATGGKGTADTWKVTRIAHSGIDEAVVAIARLSEIDRAACRAAVAARFTVERMADRYLALYRSILG